MQYIFIGKKLGMDANTLSTTFIHLICDSILGNKCACHPQHYASLSVDEQEIISRHSNLDVQKIEHVMQILLWNRGKQYVIVKMREMLVARRIQLTKLKEGVHVMQI